MTPAIKMFAACVTALLILALPAVGQEATTTVPFVYEVASVKPHAPGERNSQWRNTPSGISMVNLSLLQLLSQAYSLDNSTDDQISGLPAWAKSQRWDISAKVAEADSAAFQKLESKQRGLLLQKLLVDRFHLAAHLVTQEKPVYALLVAKRGSKLTEAAVRTAPDGTKKQADWSQNRGHLEAHSMTLDTLASILTNVVQRTVLNRTGLLGIYDMDLRWTPDDTPDAATKGADGNLTATAPPLFTALQEQLGLRLDAQKGPVDGLVVDHIDMPSAN